MRKRALCQVFVIEGGYAITIINQSWHSIKKYIYLIDFSSKEISLFETYLSNRHKKVFWNGSYSHFSKVNWGVLQGSFLGPFLFLVMVNDLDVNVQNKSVMFADDARIFTSRISFELVEYWFNLKPNLWMVVI